MTDVIVLVVEQPLETIVFWQTAETISIIDLNPPSEKNALPDTNFSFPTNSQYLALISVGGL